MSLRRIGKVLLGVGAGCVVLILLAMLGLKLALDRAPRYQGEIKDWVYRRTGYHVGFASVSPAFRRYGPELYFDRLELRSTDDRRVLARAGGGRIGVDFWQLFHSGKLFALRIELDAPALIIARTGPQTFALASEIVLGGEDSSLDRLALNDLPAGTLAIRGGLITVLDWNAALPRLELRGVNLDLRRASDLAVVKLRADLPAALGGDLRLDAAAQGAGALPGVAWELRAAARGMSFPGWHKLIPEYLTRLDAGSGAFEFAVQGRGTELSRGSLDFEAQNVVANLADGPSGMFSEIGGTLMVTRIADRWVLEGRRMRALRGGRRDPESEFDVSWNGGGAGLLNLHARASYLRADALLPLAGLMPQQDIRDRLRDIAPTGEWIDMRADLIRAAPKDPWKFGIAARFRDVGYAPTGSAPGLRGLSGELAGNERGGHVLIDAPSAVFSWPNQFPEPLRLTPLKSTIYWSRDAAGLLVATRDLAVSTHGAWLRAKLALVLPGDGASPVMTLATRIEGGDTADAHLFLPREQLAPSALAWLNRAFIAGHLTHADVVMVGPLRNYPFRDHSGLFLARANIEGLSLDYQEGWPHIEGLSLLAEFRNEGLNVKVAGGRLGALSVDAGTTARFADFKTGELEVHAKAHGDANDALQFMRATPVDDLAEGGFSAVEGKGALQIAVNMFLPFKQFDQRRVLVRVDIDGGTLNRKGSSLMATDVSGEADIDGAQVVRAEVRGRVLGGAFQMSARPSHTRPAHTHLDFHGTVTGEALHGALALPASIPIGGQTEYRGVLRMSPEPARERSLRLSSSLAGLELNLPAPLAKSAESTLPVSLEAQWPASGGVQLRMALGAVLRGALTLDADSSGPQFRRAALNFGADEPAYSDDQLVNVGGSIEQLDLDGWQKLAATFRGNKPLGTYLRAAKFQVRRLSYLGLSFEDLALDLKEANGGWRVGIGGPSVVGTISIPGALDTEHAWNLDFSRLDCGDVPQSTATPDAAPPPTRSITDLKGLNPHNIPALKFHAAEVTWGDRQFGEVHATLGKLEDGISLAQFTLSSAVFSASIKGEWRGKDQGAGRIEGTITSTGIGETLKQLGFAEVIDAKSGHLDFDLSWVGAPSSEALGAATGKVQVALDKGQIVGLKPGARGRVLGLASVAELPRRLALDFSDLTDKGFAFDSVRGDFDLRDGSAFTDNLLVKGPAAEIGLIGRVGLKNKDYDQTAVVTGNLGSSPLPLAAFAAGPVVGGAVLLFTQVFKQPLRGLARGYYRITGSWDNPTVERIKSAGAAAAAAEAPK